jgi:hypothetical protein
VVFDVSTNKRIGRQQIGKTEKSGRIDVLLNLLPDFFSVKSFGS